MMVLVFVGWLVFFFVVRKLLKSCLSSLYGLILCRKEAAHGYQGIRYSSASFSAVPWGSRCSLARVRALPAKRLSFAEAIGSLISWENKANAGGLANPICRWWCKAPGMFSLSEIASPCQVKYLWASQSLSHTTLNVSLGDLLLRPKSCLLTPQCCFHFISVMSLMKKTSIKSKYLWIGLPKFKDLLWPWGQNVTLPN